MKVSLDWLKQYVPVTLGAHSLADRLTMSGLEVESIQRRYDYLATVVVGRIDAVAPHPNADKLVCCEVAAGNTAHKVVCGAPNVAEGLLVPLALPGTRLPSGVTITDSNIRGQKSAGMLCSELELDLGTDRSGLMMLPEALTPGTPLDQALGLDDTVIEIDLTPNRPDCASIVGIAREVAAVTGKTLTSPAIEQPDSAGAIHDMASVTIESPEHCPRYAARLLTDVTIGPSPQWLRDRLLAVGLRPINNIVDVTNFVMLELGQPLHAFDFDQLAEHRIVVRTAQNDGQFETLDGKTRTLAADTLMICDGRRPVAVAGVMGGLNSEISDATRRVLIESACFNPASIRRTAKRFGLGTDASYRFERGVDPEGTVRALERAAQIMTELCGATLVEGVIDVHPGRAPQKRISLAVAQVNTVLGTQLESADIARLLESVAFQINGATADHLTVQTPSFRVDVHRPEDLIEEVARLWGYNRIAETRPTVAADVLPNPGRDFREQVRTSMTGFGFTEAITYSFHATADYDRLNLADDDPRRSFVHLLNPLTEDQHVMRTAMLPGLLIAVRHNLAQQNRNLRLFEIGKVFWPWTDQTLPEEPEHLCAVWSGTRTALSWLDKSAQACDYYDIKGVVEALLDALHVESERYTALKAPQHPFMRLGHSAGITVGDKLIGLVGEIEPAVLPAYDIAQPVMVCELDMRLLAEIAPRARQAQPLSRYPSTVRDMTVIVDKPTPVGELIDHLQLDQQPLVENVAVLDIFAGKPIAANKKSVSLRITYRSLAETLQDETINALHRDITQRLIEGFGATLPA
jgi:phenylalanyl-tRNA synthetase beta chain